MITFGEGNMQVVRDNFHLVEEHWEEIVNTLQRPLKVSWDTFFAAEKNGMLRVFVAHEDLEVLGYAIFFLHPHLHSCQLMVAQNDAVFLKKEKRVMSKGREFLKYCDEELAKSGVKIIFWHVKPIRDFGPALENIGYEMHEKIYMRFVGD